MKVPGAIKAENTGAVSADHPFLSRANHGRDPVVFEVRVAGRVIRRDAALIEQRDPSQRSGKQLIAGNSESVHVVVHEALKGVQAACAAGIEKRQPSGSGEGQAVSISGDVRDVIGNEAIGTRKYLLFFAESVKANQTVCRGNVDAPGFRVRKNAIYAENVLVFDMSGTSAIGREDIQAAIKLTDPQVSGCVRRESGNVAVG